MIKIGCIVPFSQPGMYLKAVNQAISFGANTFMIYTGAPQNTRRADLKTTFISEALAKMEQYHFDLNDLVGHAPYIINLANPSVDKREFAINFLTQELYRFEKLKITQMVLHPGNAINHNRPQSIQWIAQGINQIFENTRELNIRIALETMAGKGTEIGFCFQELKQIIALIHIKKRIKICLDTCHVFDAGYDIKNNLESVIKEFNSLIGIEYLSILHINDSKNNLGSKKDRHENIGYGKIGFESLIKIIYHPFFAHIPKILETPYIENKTLPPYREELKMIKTRIFKPFLNIN